MKNKQPLSEWVDEFYQKIIRSSKLNGVSFNYYKSLRGYFRHSIMLTDIKLQDFGLIDYRVWEWILCNVKSGRVPSESGGVILRYEKVKDLCSKRSYFKTKKKLIDLKLIIATPYKDYYVLNPEFIVKLYTPKKEIDED